MEHRPELESWDEIVHQANEHCPKPVVLEDMATMIAASLVDLSDDPVLLREP